MNYKKGQRLQFDIYGTIVEGDFIRIEDSKIVIKTIKDSIKIKIGELQFIHEDFLTFVSTKIKSK